MNKILEAVYTRNFRKEKGITLIALVITIIILLILAGITITTLTQSGLFEKTKSATTKHKISKYLEKIELARLAVQEINEGKVTIENLVEAIYKDEIVAEGSITIVDEYTIMTTPEGYNFLITETDAKYVEGSKDEIFQPVTSIEIEAEKTELKIGEKATLTATINPENAFNKEIEWISENTSIIEIGTPVINEDETVSIEVTAKDEGSTMIIASAKDKSDVQEKCIITVEKDVLYLYNLGDECTDVTGGWTFRGVANGSNGESSSKQGDHFLLLRSRRKRQSWNFRILLNICVFYS